jgi:hypothetical protein
LIGAPIITVTGKAYWDVGHAPKDQSNRRSHLPGYAAFEIHPVMKLTGQPLKGGVNRILVAKENPFGLARAEGVSRGD